LFSKPAFSCNGTLQFAMCEPVGDGVSEMRVDTGAGCRVYFTIRNGVFIVLLAGGDKSSQSTDIKRA
jgi:putative addiction module killer protein